MMKMIFNESYRLGSLQSLIVCMSPNFDIFNADCKQFQLLSGSTWTKNCFNNYALKCCR